MTLTVSALGVGAGFGGDLSINQTTGEVTISNAGPVGSFTIGVTATDGCSTIVRNFTLTVLKYEAPPTIVSSLNPSAPGQRVTFTVAVVPPRGAPEPTGYVQLMVDGANRGGPVPLVRGVVSATTSGLAPGERRITAIYSGDTNYERTSATLIQVVAGR